MIVLLIPKHSNCSGVGAPRVNFSFTEQTGSVDPVCFVSYMYLIQHRCIENNVFHAIFS